MEVHDGALELAEGEGVVGAAAQAALDRLDHGTILRRAGGADELGVAFCFGQRLGVVAAAVGQRVGDLPRAVDRERLEDHQVGVTRQHGDQHVGEQVIDVGQQAFDPPLLRRHLGQLPDALERIGHAAVAAEQVDDVQVVETVGQEALGMRRLDVIALDETFQQDLPVDLELALGRGEQALIGADQPGEPTQRIVIQRR